uniref:Uncharacterized protein n=1 Tax=Arundo donax TaxID=35708 RepID=A0A0A9FJA8_ARUDO
MTRTMTSSPCLARVSTAACAAACASCRRWRSGALARIAAAPNWKSAMDLMSSLYRNVAKTKSANTTAASDSGAPFLRAATPAPSAACFIANGADANTDLRRCCISPVWPPAPAL